MLTTRAGHTADVAAVARLWTAANIARCVDGALVAVTVLDAVPDIVDLIDKIEGAIDSAKHRPAVIDAEIITAAPVPLLSPFGRVAFASHTRRLTSSALVRLEAWSSSAYRSARENGQ